jgi:hypothetical protein
LLDQKVAKNQEPQNVPRDLTPVSGIPAGMCFRLPSYTLPSRKEDKNKMPDAQLHALPETPDFLRL